MSGNQAGDADHHNDRCNRRSRRKLGNVQELPPSAEKLAEEEAGDELDLDVDVELQNVEEKENRDPGLADTSRSTISEMPRPESYRSEFSATTRSSTSLSSRLGASSRGSVASGKKMVRRSAKRQRPHSTSTLTEGESRHNRGGAATDSESSDIEDLHLARATSDMMDYSTSADIYTDNGWDTDLETEEEKQSYNVTNRTVYVDACRKSGVIPASYFVRHMDDQVLEMKHHGLGPQGAKPISVALVSNTKVLQLNLKDNWLGLEGGMHVCEMLKENCYISDVDLSDNKLGLEFAEKFIDVLANNITLTHVTLAGNDLDDKAAVFIAEAIMSTSRLEYLNLSRNKLGEKAGALLGPALAENTSIKHLDLSWNHIRRKGALELAKGIKLNIMMIKINLSWNGLGNDGAKALGDALKTNTVLEELDVSNNRMTAEGAVLLGKGVAISETLQVLKMGQNPMQSAGCYAICTAVSKNPNLCMQLLDFSDIMVNNDFLELYVKVKEQLPELRLLHGGDGPPKKPRARVHPFVKLKNYIEKHNLRLVDFFNKFDKDHSMSVTREEFAQGIEEFREETGIKLTDDEITNLLDELDKDGDGEINYSELVIGHQDFTEKEKRMASTIMQLKPTQ